MYDYVFLETDLSSSIGDVKTMDTLSAREPVIGDETTDKMLKELGVTIEISNLRNKVECRMMLVTGGQH